VVEEGIRVGFLGWTDGAPRIREHTTGLEDASFTATYGGHEFFITVTPTSPATGVVPGYVEFSGGDGTGWVPEGETVTVTATPRTGFQFREWIGAFQGLPNPTDFTPVGPAQTEAAFDVTFSAESNPSTVELAGGILHDVVLVAENGNYPVHWSVFSGTLPEQMSLNASGVIQGTPLVRGEFPMTLRAVDGIGLQAFHPLTLVVADPELPVEALASQFLLQGPPLNATTRKYLDNEGNQNNTFDLGDLRAYVLRNPNIETYTQPEARVEVVVPMGDLRRSPPDGEVRREDMP
jgi:hypothetical protein